MADPKGKQGETTSKKTVKDQTIRDMKALGIHKAEYNRIIDIYAELVAQYTQISAEFKRGGYQYESSTDQGGSKKSPIVLTLETLRKDILAYSDRLCLNPKALESVTADTGSKSKLADVLSRLK